mmetsp:Transcript_22670/g.58323  ORF Transcript_22670/g.58323 Transcript_22670/m.58323 type:complete len:206 (+) Transcript_22670:41-658(+)
MFKLLPQLLSYSATARGDIQSARAQHATGDLANNHAAARPTRRGCRTCRARPQASAVQAPRAARRRAWQNCDPARRSVCRAGHHQAQRGRSASALKRTLAQAQSDSPRAAWRASLPQAADLLRAHRMPRHPRRWTLTRDVRRALGGRQSPLASGSRRREYPARIPSGISSVAALCQQAAHMRDAPRPCGTVSATCGGSRGHSSAL